MVRNRALSTTSRLPPQPSQPLRQTGALEQEEIVVFHASPHLLAHSERLVPVQHSHALLDDTSPDGDRKLV